MKKNTLFLALLFMCNFLNAQSHHAVQSHAISSNPEFNATGYVISNPLCAGYPTGSAYVTATGGGAPYTYLWMPTGQTTDTATGLMAGTYTVMVTDTVPDTTYCTVTITEPAPLSPYILGERNTRCHGQCNGGARVGCTGGTPPYTYYWVGSMPPDSTDEDTGLCAGNYQVIVTDSNGCQSGLVVTIGTNSNPAGTVTSTNVSCFGLFTGTAAAGATGGIPPYTFLWNPGSFTGATDSGLGAGTYTCTITDALGCQTQNTAAVGQPPPLVLNAYSYANMATALASGGALPYTYAWYPSGSTSSFVTGLTPGTYTVVVKDSGLCEDSAIVSIIGSTFTPPADSMLRYPRWAKRGVYLEFAPHYYSPIDAGDSIRLNGTPFISYCRQNHITYVLMDGVNYLTSGPYANSCGVFYEDSAYVDAINAQYLENFIDSLKTRGGVEQVGVICYKSDLGYPDSNSWSVKNFDVANFTQSAKLYNIGLPWVKKIDYLSLDDESWVPDPTNNINNYNQSIGDFLNVHLPMLRSMWAASRNCDANFIRVEDFLSPPLDINAYLYGGDSVLYTNHTEGWMIDSVGKWTDRILLGAYTYYGNVLWNRGDWMQGDSEIGRNPLNAYYKKEIWPVFSAEDTGTISPCNLAHNCWAYSGDGYSGDWMCDNPMTPDSLEQCYYHPFSYSMEHYIFTDDNLLPFQWHHMGRDTCFKVEGNMWYDAECLNSWQFDTNEHTNAIHFQVNLGHDTLYTGGSIKLIAKPDGGTGPYYYIWYDEDRHDTVVQGISTNNTYLAPHADRYEVLALDAKLETAMDYVCVYKDTCGPTSVPTIERPLADFRIYPNPTHGLFTILMSSNYGKTMNLNIYNLMGQEVKSQEILQKSTSIDLSEEANGVYFCRFTDKNGKLQKSMKVMVIH